MRLSLSLPPLVAILLLAFVWLIVFVLLLWFFLPGGRQPDAAARADKAPTRRPPPPTDTRRRTGSDRNVGDADPSALPRPRIRAVPAEKPEAEKPEDGRLGARDAFEDFERSGRRRDETDF